MLKEDQIYDKTETMLERAYDMFPLKHKPSEYLPEDIKPFPMYSFERAGTMFWKSLIKNMYKRGMTDQEVEWLLRSKEMRWMFDQLDEKALDAFTDGLLTERMVETAKFESGDY